MFTVTATTPPLFLDRSGYNFKLKYSTQPLQEVKRKNRKRNIVWFTPPFSKSVSTNIGKEFFKLINLHFPENHVLRPIINRNSVKVSYSCLPNIGKIISSHNSKILKNEDMEPDPCNCNPPDTCPVEGQCGTKGIIYQAKVSTQTGEKATYVGLSANKFISRFHQHRSNFGEVKPFFR